VCRSDKNYADSSVSRFAILDSEIREEANSIFSACRGGDAVGQIGTTQWLRDLKNEELSGKTARAGFLKTLLVFSMARTELKNHALDFGTRCGVGQHAAQIDIAQQAGFTCFESFLGPVGALDHQ